MRMYGRAARFLERLGASYGITALRICVGTIYLWFGVPKLLPGVSPAEDLAADTVHELTFGVIGGTTASVLTGALETAIGALLVSNRALPLTVMALLGHMAGTFTPLVLFPERTWEALFIGTLEGQYILKNLVIVAAALAIVGHAQSAKGPRRSRAARTDGTGGPGAGTRAPGARAPLPPPARLHPAKKARRDGRLPAPRR